MTSGSGGDQHGELAVGRWLGRTSITPRAIPKLAAVSEQFGSRTFVGHSSFMGSGARRLTRYRRLRNGYLARTRVAACARQFLSGGVEFDYGSRCSRRAGFCRLVLGEAGDRTVVLLLELHRRDVAAVPVQTPVVDQSTYSGCRSRRRRGPSRGRAGGSARSCTARSGTRRRRCRTSRAADAGTAPAASGRSLQRSARYCEPGPSDE